MEIQQKVQSVSIKNMKKNNSRLEEAYILYDEIKELFENEKNTIYLTTLLTKEQIDSFLNELLNCFKDNDKDKFLTVNIWKSIIEKKKK